MQALGGGYRFAELLPRSWRRSTALRSFSSSSSFFSDQSRGGLPRFFSEVLPPSKGGIVRVQGDEFWHMTKVLRLSVNDRVELFNGKGGLVEGSINRIDRTGLDFIALEDPKLVLPQSSRWHVFAAFENRVDRLQRVILAAAKQCQRLHEMTLNPPTTIDSLLPIVTQSKLSLVAVAEATPVFSVLTSSRRESTGLMIIGPEGDFTEKELNMMREAGATAVGLGPHRLRVETATIALLATLMLWSDSERPSEP
ncbi:uncharacterized protein LOC100258322 isoform X2 [Vitis vinifera]|uniref:uncharacterized protein LOC100258322 isoform X2 n=1 Tax=Vitis vinifera TaxID=29760 RepID=UPI0008FFCB20|nr:uncharacterized protein LOC100258322 isoform X2 [Vitis vinifera]|eukprot:XP_019074701.1 PREDICTED: uncharacterized protein LOC100258322 isoform X2 [Vitis vinifera]